MPFDPVRLALIAVPVLLSLTLHEFGHARVALAFGDDTAKRAGRVTLNPLAHLDFMGTLCFMFGPVGWAKPVPVDPLNLHPRRTGDVAVSLAGVGMNLLLAALAVVGLTLMAHFGVKVNPRPSAASTSLGIVAFMLAFLIRINVCLIVFNLLPLFPLDGHHVLREALPVRMHAGFMLWQRRFGQLLLMGLVVLPWLLGMSRTGINFNPIGRVLVAVIRWTMGFALSADALELARNALWRHGFAM